MFYVIYSSFIFILLFYFLWNRICLRKQLLLLVICNKIYFFWDFLTGLLTHLPLEQWWSLGADMTPHLQRDITPPVGCLKYLILENLHLFLQCTLAYFFKLVAKERPWKRYTAQYYTTSTVLINQMLKCLTLQPEIFWSSVSLPTLTIIGVCLILQQNHGDILYSIRYCVKYF